MPQPIDYHRPPMSRPNCPALPYWTIYLACSAVSFLWLMDLLEIRVQGRPGDEVVKFTELATVVLTCLPAALLHHLKLRHARPLPGLITAATLGLLSPLFGYLSLWILF